jgi:thiol-disulfide isomerase/thioredoxin
MKKSIFTIAIAALTLPSIAFAKDKIIVNPAYEFTTSGVTYITRVELGKKETRLHVKTIFLPNWWVKFPKATYIEDCATGKRWQTTGIINGELDKEIYMPADGDSTFILLFPPLDKSVTKINFGDSDEKDATTIYGISLDPKAKPKPKEIPADVLSWIDREVAAAKRSTLMDVKAGEFFARDTVRLVGYINGYDPRAGFSSAIIYTGNVITREDFPTVIQIHADGRFEGNIPMNYPAYLSTYFENIGVNFYVEPGQTLAMLLDWEEFRMADRLRNIRYKFKDIQFRGAAAELNAELTPFHSQLPEIPVQKIYDEMKNKQPEEFKVFYDNLMADYTNTYHRLLAEQPLSERAKAQLRNEYKMRHATHLFEYETSYRHNHKDEKLPSNFYDFLQDIPMDDKTLLSTPEFSTFINRLEYCTPFEARHHAARASPKISFTYYLFEELGIQKTAEDEKFLLMQDSLPIKLNASGMTREKRNELIGEYLNAQQLLLQRHGEQHSTTYSAKYVDVLKRWTAEETITERWRVVDSIYTHELKLKSGIIPDICKVRSLDFTFGQRLKDDKEDAARFLASITSSFGEPFLTLEAERIFKKNFPEEKRTAYELPNTKDAAIFKEIIAPFKGKILLVDFWATTCGPCVYNIKHHKALREKYKDSPDVAFIFITDEKLSPLSAYARFVEEQELTNAYRLSSDQYRHMRQLFRFYGIPHYVLVDREGKILDDDAREYDIENRLKEILL